VLSSIIVKWLGPNRIRPLAIDGKGTKEKVTADMKQWGSAQGRMVVNPGEIFIGYKHGKIFNHTLINYITHSSHHFL
jgi:hypothetical protein